MSETTTPYTVGKAWSTKSTTVAPTDRDWPISTDTVPALLVCDYCEEAFWGPRVRKCCRVCYLQMQSNLANQHPRDPEPAEGIIRQIRNLLERLERVI